MLLILVVAAGAWAGVQRHLLLQDNRQVELAVDSRLLFSESPQQNGFNSANQLEDLKKAGCTAVGVRPLTIAELENMGRITLLDVAEIRRLQALGVLDGYGELPGGNLPGGLFILTEEKELHEILQAALSSLLGETTKSGQVKSVVSLSGNDPLFIPGSYISVIEELPLIMPREQMRLWNVAGLRIIPHFYAPSRLTPEISEQYWSALASQLEIIIEEEEILLGPVAFPSPSFTYPAPRGDTGVLFAEKELTLGNVEFTAGKGLGELASLLDYRVVRTHQIPTSELGQLGEERASERFLRAVQERSVRLLLLSPFPELDPRGEFTAYLSFIKRVADDLERAGFEVGECLPFPVFNIHLGVQALLFAGTAMSAAFLAGLFFLGKTSLPLPGKKKRKHRTSKQRTYRKIGITRVEGATGATGVAGETGAAEVTGLAGATGITEPAKTLAETANASQAFVTKEQRIKTRLEQQKERVFIALSICLFLAAAALPLLYKTWAPVISAGGGPSLLSHLPSAVFLEKGTALLASLIFPTLGVILFLEPALSKYRERGYLTEIVKGFLYCTLFSAGGALAASGILGSTEYILKIEAFGGVKISQVGPFIVLGLFILQQKRGSLWNEITELLNKEVKVKYLLALVLAGGVLLVYLVRGGNIPLLPVSEIELALRRQLEIIFIARPRFKEFLIGHPGLFLMAALCPAGIRGAKSLALVLGLLGQISLFNTFMHLHRPVSLSLLGTIYGAAIGLLLGLILFYLATKLYSYQYNKYRRKYR